MLCKLYQLYIDKYIIYKYHLYINIFCPGSIIIVCTDKYMKVTTYFISKNLNHRGVKIMSTKKDSLSIWTVIGLIAAVSAIVASVTTAMLFIKKKEKEDKELEEYLDYSIQ